MDEPGFDRKGFGSRLRVALETAGWKVGAAADRLGIPQSRVSEYLLGTRTPPVPRLLWLVRELGLDIRIIFPAEAPEPVRVATVRRSKNGGAECTIETV